MSKGQLPPAPCGKWHYIPGPTDYLKGHAPTEARGSFHLVVDPNDLDSTREKVKRLTITGKLGYGLSICEDPMSYGCERLVGKYTILVHCLHSRKEEMRENLEKFELFSLAFNYNLIRQFRTHNNCLEYFNEYEKLYEKKTRRQH